MVRSRNREPVSLSNPQISIKLLSKAAAIFRAPEHAGCDALQKRFIQTVRERLTLSVAPSGMELQLHPLTQYNTTLSKLTVTSVNYT